MLLDFILLKYIEVGNFNACKRNILVNLQAQNYTPSMTAKIQKLDEKVINQIAAGEVVERPASVIKELLENAIDAGATQVTIELEQGGKTLIKVIDNGSGVTEDQIALTIERHATSKIRNLHDLETDTTLGFRGEALASISSVSDFEFASYPESQNSGYAIDSNGEIQIKAMPYGTQVTVKHLFYNTPAREKFLKTDSTEYKNCLEIIESYCLSYPEVNFALSHNSRQVFNYQATDRKSRVTQVLGQDFASKLLPVHYEGQELSIEGFVGLPELAKSKAYSQYFLVNGRQIKAHYFTHAVQKAYETRIFPNEKIPFILWINIAPADVDMNVHPRKEEDRFHYQSMVYAKILKAVRHTLGQNTLTPEIKLQQPSVESFLPSQPTLTNNPSTPQHRSSYKPSKSESKAAFDLFKPEFSDRTKQSLTEHRPVEPQIKVTELNLKPLSQIDNSYILCLSPEGLTIIDQHAAHERVLYAKFKAEAKLKKPSSQKLLVPIQIELSNSEKELLLENAQVLESIGFDIEEFGGQTISIQSMPSKFKQSEVEDTIRGLVDDLKSGDFDSLEAREEVVINYAACRGAIKFGQPLTMDEIYALIAEMEQTEGIYSCPHGRPTMIKLTYNDLEKQFKRKK